MMYNINFGTGKLEPIDESTGNKNNLPVGTVLHMNGYSCPDFVIMRNLGVNPQFASHGASYDCMNLTTGEEARKQAYSLAWLRDKKDNRIQTYITDRVMTSQEMTEAMAKALQVKAENDQYQKEKAEREAKEKAELPAKYPYLQVQDATIKSRILATKNIKTELKRLFPSVKFSIKSDSFSGGDSIHVSWTDGPVYEEVNKITGKYQDGHFNGMEDIYEYGNGKWTDTFGGAKYVHADRHISAALIFKAAKEMGFDLPSGESDNYGNLPGLDSDRSQMIYRHSRTLSA